MRWFRSWATRSTPASTYLLLYDYASAAGLNIQLNVLVDPPRSLCLIVSGVSALIHLYSISYMTSTASTGSSRT